jgi:hypothetical protein
MDSIDSLKESFRGKTLLQMQKDDISSDIKLKLLQEGDDAKVIIDENQQPYALVPYSELNDILNELSNSKRELLMLLLRDIAKKERALDIDDVVAVTVSRLNSMTLPSTLKDLEVAITKVVKDIKKSNPNLFHKDLDLTSLINKINI